MNKSDMVNDIDKIIMQIIGLRKKYKIRSLDRNDYGVDEFIEDLSTAQESLEEAKRDALRMISSKEEKYPSGLSGFGENLLRMIKKR